MITFRSDQERRVWVAVFESGDDLGEISLYRAADAAVWAYRERCAEPGRAPTEPDRWERAATQHASNLDEIRAVLGLPEVMDDADIAGIIGTRLAAPRRLVATIAGQAVYQDPEPSDSKRDASTRLTNLIGAVEAAQAELERSANAASELRGSASPAVIENVRLHARLLGHALADAKGDS